MVLFVVMLVGCGGFVIDIKIDIIDLSEFVLDWVVVWEDNFDGDFIDEGKWNFEIDCVGGGNNEK